MQVHKLAEFIDSMSLPQKILFGIKTGVYAYTNFKTYNCISSIYKVLRVLYNKDYRK